MLKRLIFIAIVTAAAVAAHAQGDFLHRPSPFAGRTLLTLALFDEVRTELKTTPDENTKIDGLVEKLQGDMQDAFQNGGGDPGSMRATIEKVNAKYDEQVTSTLTPDQTTRLKQLFVQFNGNGAIANSQIEKDLAVTDDQKTKINAAQDEAFQKLFAGGGGPPDADTMKKYQEDLGNALLKVLTDDQKTKFQGMQGAKFEFKKG